MHFTVQRRNGQVLPTWPVVLNLPGRHNVLNALSAIAVAVELGIDDSTWCGRWPAFRASGDVFSVMEQCPARTAAAGSRWWMTMVITRLRWRPHWRPRVALFRGGVCCWRFNHTVLQPHAGLF
jgi:hypothetical protein